MKKLICLLLAAIMLLGIFAGCGKTTECSSTTATEKTPETKPEATQPDLTGDETGKQAPMLQAMVDAGTLPHLADRIPVASDVYVEVDNAPSETPSYGGTMRTTTASGTLVPLPKSPSSGCWMTAPWRPMWQRAMTCPTTA